jgi:hypothetical protein
MKKIMSGPHGQVLLALGCVAVAVVVLLLQLSLLSIFQIWITCIHIAQPSSRLLAEHF